MLLPKWTIFPLEIEPVPLIILMTVLKISEFNIRCNTEAGGVFFLYRNDLLLSLKRAVFLFKIELV